MNVRSSTHLMRAFIKATHNHESPIANRTSSFGFMSSAASTDLAYLNASNNLAAGPAWRWPFPLPIEGLR
jgi:hypothetical protein